jgi:hypothetical protein
MKSLLYVVAIACAVFATGCRSTGVVPMDQNSFMIAKKDGTPGLGVSFANKAEVYQEASTFCKAKGQEVKTLRVETTPARPGQLGGTELQFKCVAPGGDAQPLAKEADQVVEVRNR